MTIPEFCRYLQNLDNSPESTLAFDMNMDDPKFSKHPCKSACCLGGHARILLGDDYAEMPIAACLAEVLDIPEHDAERMCWPGRYGADFAYNATVDQACEMLEIYAKHEWVDWHSPFGLDIAD